MTKRTPFPDSPLAIIAVVCLLLAGSLALIRPADRMRLYPDDGMFYGIVATNTVQGAPFSFDGGVSRTTGFHWAGLFPPLAAAAARRASLGGGAYRDFFDAIFAVDALATGLAAFALALAARRMVRSRWTLGLLAAVLFQVLLLGFGMESSLAAPLLLALLVEATGEKPRKGVLFALALAVPVARLDLVPIAALAAALGVALPRRTERPRLAVAAAAGLAVGVALVFVANTLVGGEPFSSSVIAKGTAVSLVREDLLQALAANAAFLVGFAAILAARLAAKPLRDPRGIVVAAIGLLLLLQVSVQRSLGGNNLGRWYDVVWTTLFFVSAAALFDSLPARGRAGALAGVVCLGICALPLAPREAIRSRLHVAHAEDDAYYASWAEFGEAVRRSVPEGARLAADDLPGALCYYSRRPVVALDGLANSPEFVRRYVLTGRVGDYVREEVDYVALFLDDPLLRRFGPQVDRGAADIEFPIGFLHKTTIPAGAFRFSAADVVLRTKVRAFWSEFWLVRVPKGRVGV